MSIKTEFFKFDDLEHTLQITRDDSTHEVIRRLHIGDMSSKNMKGIFEINSKLHDINEHEKNYLEVSICSDGGNVDTMLTLLNGIQRYKHKKVTGIGNVSSAAAIMFLSFKDDRSRYITSGTRMLFHRVSIWLGQTTSRNGEKLIDHYEKVYEDFYSLIEYYLTAKEKKAFYNDEDICLSTREILSRDIAHYIIALDGVIYNKFQYSQVYTKKK